MPNSSTSPTSATTERDGKQQQSASQYVDSEMSSETITNAEHIFFLSPIHIQPGQKW